MKKWGNNFVAFNGQIRANRSSYSSQLLNYIAKFNQTQFTVKYLALYIIPEYQIEVYLYRAHKTRGDFLVLFRKLVSAYC